MNIEETLEQLLELDTGEAFPNVDEASLTTAHEGLKKQLSFPLKAVYSEPDDNEQDREFPVTIVRLLPLEDHPDLGRYLGLLCEVRELGDEEIFTVPLSRIVNAETESDAHFIEAYNEWFWQFR